MGPPSLGLLVQSEMGAVVMVLRETCPYFVIFRSQGGLERTDYSGSNGINLPAFLWTAYAQSGFSDSNRRTQRDHKLRLYDQASAAFGRCKLK
jgi:hypothetical protein